MKHKIIILPVIFLASLLILPGFLAARNAPITTAGSSTVCPGGNVTVPVTVTSFTSIEAITLRLDYNPNELNFVGFANLNAAIASGSVNTVNVSPTLTKIMIVWSDITPISLANGSKLVDLNFTLTTGIPLITFNNTDNGGGDCEYADENGAPMNDVPTSTYYINATISNNYIGDAGIITGTQVLCAGTNNVAYSVPAITNATGYIWTVPTGGSIISGGNTRSIVVNYATTASSGNITVKGTNSCGQGLPSSLPITINPLPVPVITGSAAVCAGSTGNGYSTSTGMTGYVWTVSAGGTVTGGSGTSAITVTWNTSGAQTVSVVYTNTSGCTAAPPTIKTVTVNPLPVPTITGNSSVCAGAANVPYTTEASMSSYAWNIPAGGTIVSGAATNSILVNWTTAGSQAVTVNYAIPATGCTAATPVSKAVTVNSLPVPSITGAGSVCAGSAGNTYTTETGMSAYVWNVSAGGSVTSGGGASSNNVTITWTTAGAQSVTCNYTTPAGCTAVSPTSKTVTVNTLPVPTISGPSNACAGSPGNVYSTETGMTGYTWIVSAGGSVTSGGGTANNSVTVTWNTAGSQSVSCNYTNPGGCYAASATSKPVTVNALPVPTLTGPLSVCNGSSGNIYSTENGMTGYSWIISAGGSVTGGGSPTNNTVTVTWNGSTPQTVSVNYTNPSGCSALNPVVTNVTINPLPAPTITGSSSVCEGTTGVAYTTEAGMSSYLWTVSAGGAITAGTGTNNITVSWISAGTQTVSVNYTNAGNCTAGAPVSKTVTVAPFPAAAGAIAGNGSVCAGSSGIPYSVSPVANASSYNWALPGGATIATGSGTSNITVNFSASAVAGNITVTGTNSCGNGTTSPSLPVTIFQMPAAAGPVTGPNLVCAGTNNVVYSVASIANAVTYDWTVPAGASITAGATTNQITVSFSLTAGTGNITVKGTNVCGSGAVSPALTITMVASQGAPVVTASGSLLTSSTQSGNQWYYEGTGAIPGATSQTYTATITGWYWTVVMGVGCPSLESNHVYVLFDGLDELATGKIRVFPVPNDGRFKVFIPETASSTYTILVFNPLGEKIFERDDIRAQSAAELLIDIRPAVSGMYSVLFLSSDHTVVRKVLVK
ncbi:MAG: cohesin domain-containing protein [Bacteroidota bacterium]